MRGWRRWNLVAVVVAAVAGAMLAPDEVLAGDGLIQAALRAVDYNSGKLTSILAADSTTPVAPLAATDQGVAFIVHNPARLDLIARFATCRTTTPLVVTEALLDAQSRTLIASGSASPWEITTQSFYVPLPKEPATLAVAFGFDASYAWRQLPQEVAYNFYLYDARTMDVVGLVETIRVLPRNPTVPWLYLAQPAPGRRVYQGQPLEFSGDAYDSFDQSAVTTWMLWKRANGAVFGNGPQVTVSDWLPGEHVARLEVANSARITTAVTTLVSVVAPQPPTSVTIVYPTTGVSVPYGTPLTVEGVAYDFVDGVVSDPGMNWNSDRQAGLLATGRFATVSLAEPLTNTIVLTAVNSIGMAAVASVEVFVEPPLPSVQIVQPSNGQPWIVGQTLSLEGHATSPSEGTLTGEALVWRDGAGQLLGTGESVTTTPATTGAYAITLEATTSFGKTARVTHTVNVLAVPPPMATITGPDPGGAYYETLPVTFVGYGYDQAYGAWIEDPGLNWSSSLIGPLGQGRSFQVLLPAGEHVVTLTATGNATSGTATMALVVQPAANIPGPTVEIESPAAGQLIHTGESVAFVGWAHEYPSVQIFDQQAAWTSSVDGVVARGLLGQSGAPRATLSTGVHELSLAITDSRGKTTVATWSVTVLDGSTFPAPVAGIDSVTLLPRPGAYGGGPIYRDSAVLLQGHATDWKGQPLTVAQFSWTSSLQGALGTGATTAAEMTVAGTHVVTLAVTDNRGLTDVTTMALEVLSRPPPELEVQLSDEVTIYRPPDPIGWDPYTWSREGTKYHGNALHLRAMSWDPVDGPLPVDVTASSIGYVMTVPPESFPQFVATTAELCVGRHDLSFLATNSAGMTTERTRSLRVLPLLPAARSMLSFSKYMDVIYDLADVDGAAYPGGFKWGGWNLPVLKVTTSTVGLESVIRGHPTTILVNGEPQPFTHDGEYARFSVASIPLLTGTNVLTMTCSRDSDVFITTEAVVYNDGVTNHPPSISNPSGTHPYAWGTWFRVDLDGHDFNWDYCSRTVQMSYKPLEVATEGDWLDAPVFQAIDCDVMRRVCPPAWFGWPGQLTYNIVKPGWDWPGYPGGGWGWQQRHEGPIWLRMRAFDGKAQSDWTTAAQPMDYDPAQPRGMTNFRVVANETGSLTVSWDAAQDANFDTYFISAEFTNRFVFPPLQSYHLIGGREGDLGGYGTWRQIDYWMSRITYRATMAVDSTFTTSSTTQCTITTLPAGVEIELRLWARDTHGNLSSPVMLTTWTASDFVHAEPVTDFINPAPNPYAHRLGTTCSVRYTLAATLPILVNVYHHDTQALVRSWATTGVAGENEIVWDGKDHLGLRVDEGEYAIRLETTQPNRTKSISDSYFIRVQY